MQDPSPPPPPRSGEGEQKSSPPFPPREGGSGGFGSPSLALDARPTWKLVLTLAWPVLIQQLLAFVVTVSDALLAGRFPPPQGKHEAAQAAQTTAIYLGWLVTNFTFLVSVGSTALVARFIGAGQPDRAVRVANQSIPLAIALGLTGSVAGLVGLRGLLDLLQVHGEVADFAAEYLKPLFALLVFQVVEAAGIACLVGAGDTRTGMVVLTVVAVVNLPLAWAFHRGVGPIAGLGFPGIALGTAVSHVIGGLLVLLILARGRAGLRLHLSLMAPDWKLLRRILRVSIPAGLDSLSVGVGQLWFLSVVNRLGDVDAGAHGIALRWEALSFLTGSAFGTAAMTLVGQNLGAGQPERAARSAWTAFALACGGMCFFGAVFYVLAPQMFELFCPTSEQRPIVEAGVPVLRLIAFAMPPLAATIVFTAALRGAGDTRVPVLFTLVGFFALRVPLAFYLTTHGWGLMGAWLAMFADVVLRGVFFALRFASGRWKKIEV